MRPVASFNKLPGFPRISGYKQINALGPSILLTNTFVRPILAQQFEYRRMIDNPEKLSLKEKEILGFRWNYSLTPKEWRLARVKKL